jgi:hypothetical protein
MSALESHGSNALTWERVTDELVVAATDPAIDAAAEQRADIATTQAAIVAEYTSWYEAELLPKHEQTWDLALDALVRYGREMRATTVVSGPQKLAISTGMLALGGAKCIGNDTLASVLRVSSDRSTSRLRRAITKAQRPDATPVQHETARAMLHDAVQEDSLTAQTFLVSTNRERLPHQETDFVAKEVSYPRTRGQRMFRNFQDDRSLEQVAHALQSPDVQVYAEPLPVLQRQGVSYPTYEMTLVSPRVFTPHRLSSKSWDFATLEEAQQAGIDHQRGVTALEDMLLTVERPLRDIVAFQHMA